MEIQSRPFGDIQVIDFKGILDTATSGLAQEQVRHLLDAGHQKIVINLALTDYMSSSGLRVLLATAKKLMAVNGKLFICSPNKVVKDILDTSGFSLIMDVVDREEDAIQQLQF